LRTNVVLVFEITLLVCAVHSTGLFLGGSGKLLAAQLVGIVVLVVWTAAVCLLFFGLFHPFYKDKSGHPLALIGGGKRVSKTVELNGLDVSSSDGHFYPPYLWPLIEQLEVRISKSS
jgi:hypothetical protein